MIPSLHDISVILCTRNRSRYLVRAIDSILAQSIAPSRYELIVVDNGSSDDSPDVVRMAAGRAGERTVRYVLEPVIGLSVARNTGALIADGAYLAFLDDDALATPCWLENILAAFQRGGGGIGCVGGRIELVWEKERPVWLQDWMLMPLGRLDISDSPVTLSGSQYLFGGNFAIPRQLLEDVGMFATSLGRRGSLLLSNEEVELQNRLTEEGYGRYYDPAIMVYHHARKECLSRLWYLKRRFWHGVSECIQLERRGCGTRGDTRGALGELVRACRNMLLGLGRQPYMDGALGIAYSAGRLYGLMRGR